MINQITSISAIETVLMRLSLRQKQLIYQIARLDYRIFKSLALLETVNVLINDEEHNIKSLDAAIKAAGEGNVSKKLTAWKIKAEYKLFKLHLRKNKIDPTKIIINQSKLGQHQQALIALEKDIANIKVQKQVLTPIIEKKEIKNESILTFWQKSHQLQEQNPVNQSIRDFLKDLKMAS